MDSCDYPNDTSLHDVPLALPAIWLTYHRCAKLASMKLKVILEPSDDGGFTVYVPSLPGCVSEGDTLEESLANIKEAIALYLEPTESDLLPIEPNQQLLVQEIEL